MNTPYPLPRTARSTRSRASRRRGFTLSEVMVALTLCMLLVGAILPTFVSGLMLGMKTIVANRNGNNIRLSAEHMAGRINGAVGTPRLDPAGAVTAARVVYTTAVGLPGKTARTDSSSRTLSVSVDGTCHPAPGDRVKIAGLELGDGLLVTAVTDSRTAGGSHSLTDDATITLTFATSIAAGTTGTPADVAANQSANVFRESAYQVAAVDGKNQLQWFEQASATTPTTVVAYNLAVGASDPFRIGGQPPGFRFPVQRRFRRARRALRQPFRLHKCQSSR